MSDSLTLYHEPEEKPDLRAPDPHQDTFSLRVFGFWIYLMTDCLLFAALFATYAVLHKNTFGGPAGKEIFNLKITFLETILLLMSSIACGLTILSSIKKSIPYTLLWMAVTFSLGISFVTLELFEFHELIEAGHIWTKSAFLSSFFTLVGTHGLHVSTGLFWLAILSGQIYLKGITMDTFRRLVLFGMFWHFLDLVWIFIFTFVYLLGVV